MEIKNKEEFLKLIYTTITSIPGTYGYIKEGKIDENPDLEKIIDLTETNDLIEVNLSISLAEWVNIKDVSQEVQVRVRYELEKSEINKKDCKVNVSVKDLII